MLFVMQHSSKKIKYFLNESKADKNSIKLSDDDLKYKFK